MDDMTIAQWFAQWFRTNGIHEAIAKFLLRNPMFLDPPLDVEEDRVYPNRVGWIAVSELLEQAEETDSEVMREQFSKLIGREVGVLFTKFVGEYFNGIKIRW